MRRWIHCGVAVLVLVFLGTGVVMATTVPERPSGYVNDYAHLLTPDQSQRISAFLHRFEQKTTDQVVVATFNSLGQDSPEDFSIHLADQWKIGTKAHDNGVILLIVKEGHHIRIEVGYGLEGVLTDALSGIIIRHDIAPYFKNQDYYQGIDHGVKAITQSIQGEYHATDTANAYTHTSAVADGQDDSAGMMVVCTILFLLAALYVVISIVGNAIVSLFHLLTSSRQTHANRWFGPHRFFCLTLYGVIVGLLWGIFFPVIAVEAAGVDFPVAGVVFPGAAAVLVAAAPVVDGNLRSLKMSLNLEQRTAVNEALARAELITSAPIHVHFRGLCKRNPMREATMFFLLNRMDNTPESNGVLIFIAEDSRRLAIMGDDGAHQKVSDDFWEDCQRELVKFFKKGEMVAGIEYVVDRIARRLQRDFPPKKKEMSAADHVEVVTED